MASSRRSSRVRRRTDARTPAIWRGYVGSGVQAEKPTHGTRTGVRFSWRILSGLIVLGMIGLLVLFFGANSFYVHTIAVGGLETLTKEEVFALTQMANYHLFWIDSEQVRQNLIESPTIADAEVRLGWPPQMVQIIIQEREPALIWEQGGAATWIDLQGNVMQLRQDRDDLIRVSFEGLAPSGLGPNDHIEADIVNGALQLRSLLPEYNVLRYSEDYGLGLRDTRGWDVWFGVGTDMPNKILIYNAIVDNLTSRGIQPNVISVADPNAVYYADLFGR